MFRSSGVQVFRSLGVQVFRSLGVTSEQARSATEPLNLLNPLNL